MKTTFFQRILLPGFLLQSVLIGGGYATGRELVEFFLSSGALGGFLGLIVATALFSLISAISFEFARIANSYNYRSFFKRLLGKGWFIYEVAYLALGILVLAVIGSVAGKIVAEQLGINANIGSIALMLGICVLVAWGTKLIEKVLAG
ncbi:MAG: putative membrane protein YkvI, partial [Oceanospirillaceae bacterium]